MISKRADFAIRVGHLVVTAMMCGIIILVQVVHYPLFSFVDVSRFAAFHQAHVHRISLIVGPLMVAEILSALVLLGTIGSDRALAAVGVLLVAGVWGVTFFIAVPLHDTLAEGYSPEILSKLVAANWVRTLGWTGRLLVAVSLVLRAFGPELKGRIIRA